MTRGARARVTTMANRLVERDPRARPRRGGAESRASERARARATRVDLER